jgi:thioredoxin reductase (NADPH)
MGKPTILAVDDDVAVSRAIVRDLQARYGADYRILRATSGDEALALMKDLALKDRPLALVVSDQRMPGITGIELLGRVRELSPESKLLLLTAYADTDVAITAINEIGLDYYMFKPWDPPEERLYPVVDDLLGDWRDDHPDHDSELRLVGHQWSDQTYDVKMFLTRNHVPYRWLDVERDPEARQLVELTGVTPGDLPLVLMPDGTELRLPSTVALAEALGLRTKAEQPLYDLCIVGGGPAGLAAAVYAASEGLRTVIVERDAPGGQAGQSASIENYLGFPRGLSGADLTHRAVAQAARFGAETVLPREVTGLEARGPVRAVLLEGGGQIEARAVVIATGVAYRRLDADGLEALGTRGVSYGATASEATQCVGEDVYVVGAANSAGQAALNFARYARHVVMVVRASELERTMSEYLVRRIRATANIEVRVCTEVVAARGDGHLEGLTLVDRSTGAQVDVETHRLFVFIGASPRTDWLGEEIARDGKGFIVTGPDLAHTDRGARAGAGRTPYALETSLPGVFAAGDVRLDSMKRVASAVGEGAMSVYLVHRYLETV